MEIGALLAQLVFFAGVIERLIEAVKRTGFVQQFKFAENIQDLIFQVLSAVFGVIAVVGAGAQVNLFALSPIYGQINPLVGQIFTGIIVGAFSNIIYRVAELLTGKPQEPPPEVPPPIPVS